jgi:hypothetical protein
LLIGAAACGVSGVCPAPGPIPTVEIKLNAHCHACVTAATGEFTETTSGVAADLFAIVKRSPVADFSVEGHQGNFTRPSFFFQGLQLRFHRDDDVL